MFTYWLGIMVVGLAIALALWIVLVLRADSKIPDQPQESPPPREIVGGLFQAWRGGRQVMPDPNESIVHDSGEAGADQPVRDRPIPEQRKEDLSERSRAGGHRA